jgi:NitT/TauT family transport system substrate-binding protein
MEIFMPKLRALLVAALLLPLGTTYAQPMETVRIQDYPGLGNFIARVAVAQKLCEKRGIRCEMKTVASAPLGMQMLLAGDLDVQYGAYEVLLTAIGRGVRVKGIGNGTSTNMYFLAVGPHMQTPNAAKGYPALMQDLKGKRVGVIARGTGTEFQLTSLLKGAGMSPNDVTIVSVGTADTAVPALRSGQVDAVVNVEPLGSFCKVLDMCRIVLDLRRGQGPADSRVAGANNVMVVSADYAAKKPATVAALQAAFKDAEEFLQNPANRQATLKVLRDTFGIQSARSEEVLESVLAESLPAFRFTLDPKALQQLADNMLRSGQIDKRVDTSAVIFASPQ